MNEKELFHKTFSKLHVSGDPVKEILIMNQTKTTKRFRPAIAAIACACALVGGTLTVNAATDGALFRNLQLTFSVDATAEGQEFVKTFGDSPNEKTPAPASVSFPSNAIGQYVYADGIGVYLTEDGKVFLMQPGQADLELTETLANNGSYTFSFSDADGTTQAGIEKQTVDGTAQYHLYSELNGEKVEGFLDLSEQTRYQTALSSQGNS